MRTLQVGFAILMMSVLLPAVGCGGNRAAQVRTFPSTPRAISELKRGWADAVVGDYPVVVHMARESMGTLEVVGMQFDTGKFGIGVNKNAPDLKAAVTSALAKVMADGSYMTALRNWALVAGKVPPPPTPPEPKPNDQIPQLADGKLHVGIEMAFPPMEFYDELQQPVGADVEIAQALAKTLGVEIEWVNMEFDGLIKAVESGQVDVLISAMTITPERALQIDFVPYLEIGSGILVVKGNPKGITRPEHLCGKNVALQEGTSQIEVVKKIDCWK